MRHLDLCSGIGGFALAASSVWPDHEVVSFVEIDEYCQKVLKQHWPNAPIHDDLKTYDARPLRGPIDLLTGGYPCQPFSTAGKREGEEDDRHLWPEVFRCIKEARPRWVLLENVAGHVSMGLDDVLSDMESENYTTAQAIIPACAVDARHRRDRVWIVAHAAGAGSEARGGDGMGTNDRSRRNGKQPSCSSGQTGALVDSEVITERAGLRAGEPRGVGRGRFGDGSSEDEDVAAHANGKRQQKRHATAVTARTGFDTGSPDSGGAEWPPEPAVGRVANGVPSRVDRLRALGNAIVPQVAAEIFRAIRACHRIPSDK